MDYGTRAIFERLRRRSVKSRKEEMQLGSSLVIVVTGFGSMKITGKEQLYTSKAMKPMVLRRIGLSNEFLIERIYSNLCLELCRYNAVTN
jgi:hypothetical protein